MEPDRRSSSYNVSNFLHNYWDILVGIVFGLSAIVIHNTFGNIYLTALFSALAIGALSITVSEIAEILAERLEEPYGSFVLTFSAVVVEIILLYMIMLEAFNSPEVLDTVKGGIISAVIVDMNVLLGIAVFVGGLAFKEQQHNEDTSDIYITILLVSASALLVPSILTSVNANNDNLHTASYLIAFLLFVFYVSIYIFQTKTHSHFFKPTAKSRILRYKKKRFEEDDEEEEEDDYIFERRGIGFNLVSIFLAILAIGIFAEVFAKDAVKVFSEVGISAGLAGLIIATISVSPEIFTAIKAAKNDQIQRVVNIAMGASMVSILLAVPILMLLAIASGIDLTLDFNNLQIGALILTVVLAWKTTDDGQTNYLEGVSHIMFFLCYAVIAAFY